MKYLKLILAIIAIGVLSLLCVLTSHIFHLFIFPVMLVIAAWGGMNFHKCKCIHKNCEEHDKEKVG